MKEAPRAIRSRLAAWHLRCEADCVEAPLPSKNLTMVCRAPGGRRAFVKAAEVASDRGVAWEGRLLTQLTAACRHPRDRLALPRIHAFDEGLGVLALEWLPGAETLHAYHRRTRRYDAPDAARVGRGLGSLHRLTALEPGRFAHLTGWAGGCEFIERILWTSPGLFASLAEASVRLIGSIQSDLGSLRALRLLRDRHQAGEGGCLVHGDLRQANVVRVKSTGRQRVVFLDWELSCWGDPARDLGSLAADYLLGWVCPSHEAEVLGQAALRSFLRALLAAYRAGRGDELAPDEGFDGRVLQWAGEALLRTAFTLTCDEGRFDERIERLSTWVIELLARPERWTTELLGAGT
ncbi:MAG: phosphotransferase family protein [Myxococcaceae bacterium]